MMLTIIIIMMMMVRMIIIVKIIMKKMKLNGYFVKAVVVECLAFIQIDGVLVSSDVV